MLMLSAAKAELRAALPAVAAARLTPALSKWPLVGPCASAGAHASSGAPTSAAAQCPAARVGEKQTLESGKTQTAAAHEDGTTVFARSHTMGVRYLRHGSLADWCGGNGDGDGDGNGNGDGNGDDDGDGSGVGVGDGVSDDNSVGDGIDEGMGGEAMMAAMAAMAAATRATATGSMATGSMAAAPRVVGASWVAAVLATAATGRRDAWPRAVDGGRGNDSGSHERFAVESIFFLSFFRGWR